MKPRIPSFFELKIPCISGISEDFLDLSLYRQHLILLVNTASKCGFTGQYAWLETLHQRYAKQGLLVVAVPTADFGGQEFSSSCEIQEFVTQKYAPSFPITSKQEITGELFSALTIGITPQKSKNPLQWLRSLTQKNPHTPTWNFNKYLISTDKRGKTTFQRFPSWEKKGVEKAIKKALL